MGCFVIMFNYMSYQLFEKPFEISYMWIGLISVAYLSGIYSSPRTARWGRVSWEVVANWFGKEKEGEFNYFYYTLSDCCCLDYT